MPVTATLTALAALSMAGVPPLLGFVSKEEAYYAFWEYAAVPGINVLLSIAAVTAATLTFAYSVRLLWGAFAGPLTQPNLYEPRWSFLAPAMIPAAAGLVLGVGVSTLNPLIDATVIDTLRQQGNADLALWHGFSVPVVMSAITIAGGIALFVQRDQVDAFLHRWSLPLRGRDLYDRAYAGLLTVGQRSAAPARTASPAAHVAYPIGVLLVAAAAFFLVADPVPPVIAGTAEPVDVGVVGALTLGIVGLCIARSRAGALALVGVVGLAVAVWFLAVGGVDLVMTQLLVEVLTVVVAVLIVRRMPVALERPSHRRRTVAAVVAVSAGLAASSAAYTLTGRREISAAGDFLLREGPALSGGNNVVNTVLVDFRGLDTLGEATVLVVAAVALLGALGATRPAPPRETEKNDSRILTALQPGVERLGNTVPFHTVSVVVGPVVAALSLLLLWRGHNDPGGGFIAALVGGAGVALIRLAPSRSRWARLPARPLLATGLLVCVGTGLIGLIDGSFLRPLRTSIDIGGFSQTLTTSLVFDVGIYLCVIGLVITGIDRLGARTATIREAKVRS